MHSTVPTPSSEHSVFKWPVQTVAGEVQGLSIHEVDRVRVRLAQLCRASTQTRSSPSILPNIFVC